MPYARGVLRVLLVLSVAAVAAGAAPAPRAASPCFDGAIVSLRTGATLHRYHVRHVARLSGFAAASALLPGADAVADGHGGWYVAGPRLGRLRGDGRLDTAWHAQLDRRVEVGGIVRARGRLFVTDSRRVYALDARTGKLLWRSAAVGGGSMARIHAIAATPTIVFLGGAFRHLGSAARAHLAALSASDGHTLAWHAPALSPYSPTTPPLVWTLSVGAERLYFAGSFSGVGGARRPNGVAAVGPRDGRLTSFAPRAPTLGTLAIAVSHGNVLLGGGDSSGIFDAKTGRLRHHSSFVGGALAVRGWTAYSGGSIRNDIGLHNLLAVDVRTGDNRSWFPNIAREVSVAKIALSGDKAFVGGQFCSTLGG